MRRTCASSSQKHDAASIDNDAAPLDGAGDPAGDPGPGGDHSGSGLLGLEPRFRRSGGTFTGGRQCEHFTVAGTMGAPT